MTQSSLFHRSTAAKVAVVAFAVSLIASIGLFRWANAATSGLTPIVTETGHISLSIDGSGDPANEHFVNISKPAGATVRKAYLLAATNASATLDRFSIKLDYQYVSHWDRSTPITANIGQGGGTNYWTDVTSMVKPKLDAAPAGLVQFSLIEDQRKTTRIDGEILAVIFDDPSQTTDNTAMLFFGAMKPAGDSFDIVTASPLDPSDPTLVVDLSLGISFGYQGPLLPNAQVSLIDVNGRRMTSSAGGQDDGKKLNGALITVGGTGDSNALPADPNSGPNGNTRYDDELYSLKSFISSGDTKIKVETKNPSNDDNIFFGAVFITKPAVIVQPTPVPTPVPATIIVEKQTLPDGDPATFTFTGDLAGPVTDGHTISKNVPAGTYHATETVPNGWKLTDITCDSGGSGDIGTGSVEFIINPGQTIKCTFTNTKLAKLTVVKKTVGGDGAFDFATTNLPGGNFTITTSGGTGNKAYTDLAPGTYNLAETVPSGWDLTASSCDDGSTLPNVVLDPGENVTCTFTNTKRGEVQIKKSTSLAGGTGFGFTQTIDSSGAFNLDDGGTQIFSNVLPGAYTVTEDDPAGSNYELSGITCTDRNSSGDRATRTATINVDPGETVVCTFSNWCIRRLASATHSGSPKAWPARRMASAFQAS